MKLRFITNIITASAILLSACSYNSNDNAGTAESSTTQIEDSATSSEHTANVFAMDTYMTLRTYGGNDEILKLAENEIHRIEDLLKRSNESGEIYKINNAEKTTVSDDTANLLKTTLQICEKTDGAFDITIAPIMDLWGFYTKDFYVPNDNELSEKLKNVNYKDISIDGNTVKNPTLKQVDLGGIAKGFTSDRLMELFKENGISSALVSLGGNVQAMGVKPDGKPWTVAIQDPFDESKYAGTLKIQNMAVITSGGYQRYFTENNQTYHHIIDPSTGKPANNGLASVSIVCKDGTMADGLSTSLFVMGLDDAIKFWRENSSFDAVFITNDGKIYITDSLKNNFSSDNKYELISK